MILRIPRRIRLPPAGGQFNGFGRLPIDSHHAVVGGGHQGEQLAGFAEQFRSLPLRGGHDDGGLAVDRGVQRLGRQRG